MVAKGSKNLTVLPPRPRVDQHEFLNSCDVAILALVPGMQGLAVPSRTFNLMAAGKPMIALVSESSEVARVMREERIGWIVEPGSVEATVQAILEARRCREQLFEMGARARHAAETKYCPEVILANSMQYCHRLRLSRDRRQRKLWNNNTLGRYFESCS